MPFEYHRHSAGKTILISSTYTIPPTTLEATTIGGPASNMPGGKVRFSCCSLG